jgi:hypothetical protein
MLNTAYDDGERPPKPDPARVAAHGDTCLYFGCEELDEAYEHLRAQGIKAELPKIAPYGMRQAVYQGSGWVRSLLSVASFAGNARQMGC